MSHFLEIYLENSEFFFSCCRHEWVTFAARNQREKDQSIKWNSDSCKTKALGFLCVLAISPIRIQLAIYSIHVSRVLESVIVLDGFCRGVTQSLVYQT